MSANPIEALASEIQKFPIEVRWLYAQCDVILALASGLLPFRGPWTRRVDRILNVGRYVGMERTTAVLLTLGLTIVVYVRQYLSKRTATPNKPLFVGIGVLRESTMLREFAQSCGCSVQELDETDYWLELLIESNILPAARLRDLRRETDELIAIFTTSARTAKRKK